MAPRVLLDPSIKKDADLVAVSQVIDAFNTGLRSVPAEAQKLTEALHEVAVSRKNVSLTIGIELEDREAGKLAVSFKIMEISPLDCMTKQLANFVREHPEHRDALLAALS